MATIKWGICGSGYISNDFCVNLQSLPDHEIVAVAAKDPTRAAEFAAKFGAKQSFGSYDELAELSDIDIVYIGNIHIFHVDTSLKFIKAGINVLCEKPMALTLEDTKTVLAAAKENNVFFLEGFWTAFFPIYNYMRDEIAKGTIGELKMIQASFCAPIISVDRIGQLDLGGGALMDFGCYSVFAANFLFNEKPVSVDAHGDLLNGIDKSGVVILRYSGGRMALCSYNGETAGGASSLTVRGTKGNFVIPDTFWCPKQLVLPDGTTKDFPLPSVKGSKNFKFVNSEGLTYQIQSVAECLRKGLKECPNHSHDQSKAMMTIFDAALKIYGVSYDNVSKKT